MKILGADIATCTGFGVGGRGVKPRSFFQRIGVRNDGEKMEHGEFLLEGYRRYKTILELERPDRAIIEAVILHGMNTNHTSAVLYGLNGVFQMVCAELGIPCEEVAPVNIKQILSGHAHAAKKHQKRALEIMGFSPTTHDECDGFGAMMCGLKIYVPDAYAELKARQNCAAWLANINDIKTERRAKAAKKKAAKDAKKKEQGELLL